MERHDACTPTEARVLPSSYALTRPGIFLVRPVELPHRQIFRAAERKSSRRPAYPAVAHSRLALTTKSKWHGMSGENFRKTSRNKRLIRFRLTAWPTLRETVSPSR